MRHAASLLCVGLTLAIAGCANKTTLQTAKPCDIPEWYTQIPKDPDYLFGVATAASQDMQLAADKAATSARAEIGRQAEVRVQSLQKRFDEEVGLAEDSQLLQHFEAVTKTVVSTSLSGSRLREQTPCRDGAVWRTYVLMEYPIGAANQALLEQLRQNSLMYTRFRSSQAFQELEDEVGKFEESKKQQ